MYDTIRKAIRFVLGQQGMQEPSADIQADLYAHLYEEMRLGLWRDTQCSTCKHDPSDCPFFPSTNAPLKRLHTLKVVYREGVPCEAFEST